MVQVVENINVSSICRIVFYCPNSVCGVNFNWKCDATGPRLLHLVLSFDISGRGYLFIIGIHTASLDQISPDRIGQVWNQEKHDDNNEQENCPFSWARSPENLLREETYLALASAFVLMRLIYIFFPTLLVYARYVWRRHLRNMRLGTLWERPLTCLKGAIQLFSHFKDPCKRSNLQGGAMNARAWAKSFATVSIGDASSSSRVCQWEFRRCASNCLMGWYCGKLQKTPFWILD